MPPAPEGSEEGRAKGSYGRSGRRFTGETARAGETPVPRRSLQAALFAGGPTLGRRPSRGPGLGSIRRLEHRCFQCFSPLDRRSILARLRDHTGADCLGAVSHPPLCRTGSSRCARWPLMYALVIGLLVAALGVGTSRRLSRSARGLRSGCMRRLPGHRWRRHSLPRASQPSSRRHSMRLSRSATIST